MNQSMPIFDLDYAEHEQRQLAQLDAETLREALTRVAAADCARWDAAAWQPLPYPGFAFQAMAAQSPANAQTVAALEGMRERLTSTMSAPGRLYPLPTASFHQTVVNTFSGERRAVRLEATGLLDTFAPALAEALRLPAEERDVAAAADDPVEMSLCGVAVFRKAIGVLGRFADPTHYARVIALRDRVYGHPALAHFGLQRTRPFIGHVTLAYFEAAPDAREQAALLDAMAEINERLLADPVSYRMPAAVLCEYADLSAFTPHPLDLRLTL